MEKPVESQTLEKDTLKNISLCCIHSDGTEIMEAEEGI